MKKKILIIVLLLTAILIWLVSRGSKESSSKRSEPVRIENQDEPNLPSRNVRPQRAMEKPESFVETQTRMEKGREEQRERSLNEWRTPINFYGKVVDENEQGVSGVHVAFGWTDLSPIEGYSRAQTLSDSNGMFSLHDRTGKSLSVAVTKEGYYTAKPITQYFEYGDRYAHFIPDSNNPIVFHLRKKGQAESLIHVEFPGFAKYFQLKGNSEPVEFDLINGKPVPLGQGHIRFVFAAGERGRTIRRFDWKLTLSVPNGGLKVTSDEFPYLAPEDEYEESHEIDMTQSSGNWRSEIQTQYFLKLSNGTYGRISFRLLADNGVFRFNSFINPTGSRNLEFDSAVQPKQTRFE